MDELVESHPRYHDHRGPFKLGREFAKVFCHATNYGASARTVAGHTGRSLAEVERAQKIWFGAHPGIVKWHERTKTQINTKHFVENKFGYRWHIFGRIDTAFNEALAWVPQSTVGILINKIWVAIEDNIPEVEVLLQNHDALGGQFPTHLKASCESRILHHSKIVIPYDDPLYIPIGIKTSERSWGGCS